MTCPMHNSNLHFELKGDRLIFPSAMESPLSDDEVAYAPIEEVPEIDGDRDLSRASSASSNEFMMMMRGNTTSQLVKCVNKNC